MITVHQLSPCENGWRFCVTVECGEIVIQTNGWRYSDEWGVLPPAHNKGGGKFTPAVHFSPSAMREVVAKLSKQLGCEIKERKTKRRKRGSKEEEGDGLVVHDKLVDEEGVEIQGCAICGAPVADEYEGVVCSGACCEEYVKRTKTGWKPGEEWTEE